MSNWFSDNALSIGRTPLVRLNRVTQGAGATVLAKIEGRNPAYSVKCRIGAAMIWDAEKRGLLGPGKEIVEPTSGNTGIALAFVAAARGIPITLTMPETMSVERRKLLVAYGAKLVLTEGAKGMNGAIAKAEEIAASDPVVMFCCSSSRTRQTRRSTNRRPAPRSGRHRRQRRHSRVRRRHRRHHYRRFALLQEDPRQTAAVGRGRAHREPRDDPDPRRRAAQAGPAQNPGARRGFHPGGARHVARRRRRDGQQRGRDRVRTPPLARRRHSVGISSGAAVAAAVRIAQRPENTGKTIVVILPDSGERYLSTVLFEGIFDASGVAI